MSYSGLMSDARFLALVVTTDLCGDSQLSTRCGCDPQRYFDRLRYGFKIDLVRCYDEMING